MVKCRSDATLRSYHIHGPILTSQLSRFCFFFIDSLVISGDIRKMGSKIPKPIKLDVIRKWLEGKSRNNMAKEVGIGAGTVSGIIQEFRQNDPEFDLLREAAVKLKNQGINIESFASLVRLREILNQIEGIDHHHDQAADEKIESLIVSLEVFCFKQNLSIKEFVNLVHDISWKAEILGVPLEKL